ncbi:DNA-binding MarR family transcriptional regulator [Sinomonas atrocyanea]|jgi:DNA-binding MarR family transcriptional regulator|uniref:MarR family winged helix-turn-helix transcriptional regulator n=1 Tax=Sinomonas atrocyanea TaxID=37927 RepID=UPI00277FE644|nr:MarR family transcriptional regulator [Sinomonas atrocyanea]MDP9884683.1 DNA-binding MarR family transcriptional regulator [Sinomonas atrocyanea]
MNEELAALAEAFRDAIRYGTYMARRLDELSELSVAQLSVLNMVAGEGLRMGVIAKNLGVRVPTATEQVARLEKAGLLERCSDPHDARAVVVRRTPEGDATAQRANTRRTERMAAALATLDDDERAALAAALPVMDKINQYVMKNQELPA